jgi:nucleoside-diphosphate-sugar epimerase
MNALVTGANGFIGLHLVHRLEELGFKVNALDISCEKVKIISKENIFEGDIFNNELLKRAIYNVEIVFNLVAKTHDFSGKQYNDGEYFRINVEGTRNLLNACIRSKVKHFVNWSSTKAMAEESENILDETFPPNPTTPYGESKLIAEKIVTDYGNKYGFKTTSIRLPLVYGPGNKGNIYKLIESIDRRQFIMIGRGENKRSMVYVGNVVDAALAVVGREVANSKVYIVTDGIDYIVRELYRVIAKGLAKRTLPFYVPMSIARRLAWLGDIGSRIVRKPLPFNSEVMRKLTGSLTFSSRKIQEEIGFQPKFNLYNSISETIFWYKKNKSKSL